MPKIPSPGSTLVPANTLPYRKPTILEEILKVLNPSLYQINVRLYSCVRLNSCSAEIHFYESLRYEYWTTVVYPTLIRSSPSISALSLHLLDAGN
jgi:hypothetical protein